MRRKILWGSAGVLIVIAALAVVFSQTVFAKNKVAGGANSSDPQMLKIPRWFLSSLTLNGVSFTVPEQKMSIQFGEESQVSGEGGCNSFGGTYQAGKDGTIRFGMLNATLMACEDTMQQETAYFNALAQVTSFHFDNGKLILTSSDTKTSLVFMKPPK